MPGVRHFADGIRLREAAPYRISVELRENQLNIAGHMPDQTSLQTLLGQLQEHPGAVTQDLSVADGSPAGRRLLVEKLTGTDPTMAEQIALQTAAGAPDGWMALLTELADGLALFIDVRAEVSDQELRLTGTMDSTLERERLLARLRAYEQQGYQLDLDVTAADEEVLRCQQQLDQLLRTPIEFRSASAQIGDGSDALLQGLAETLTACPDARVTIAGHTDDRGRADANLLLSRRRAEAVAARLIDAGVNERRITTVGYGAAQPLADNATEAGRTKNRRIEFVVEVTR